MKVKIINVLEGIPLIIGQTYKVNLETESHYIIFNEGVWCGIYKSDAVAIEESKRAQNIQLMFNI